ncbi:MAG: hypothetical protein WC881_02590 [Elusimicrobiota bacterium]|jgi:hypothetical protein
MIQLLLTAGLAISLLAAESPEEAAQREIAAVFTKAAKAVAAQSGQDARTIASSDAGIEALAPAVLKWEWRAVEPLARIASDPGIGLKVRVYALSFLGMTHDPLALPPMKGLLLDRSAAPALRSIAAMDIPHLKASSRAARSILCSALDEETLPPEVARSVLSETAHLGCEQTQGLEYWARHYGPAPKGLSRDAALSALQSLGQSRPIEAARSLLRLLDMYPPASDMRPALLKALWEKRRDTAALQDQTAAALIALLQSGTRYPATAVAAIPVLAALRDPAHIPLLTRFLADPDAEVAAVTAEALAELQVFPAREGISQLLAHAHEDPRFAPKPGRPDPTSLLERIQAAEKRLR